LKNNVNPLFIRLVLPVGLWNLRTSILLKVTKPGEGQDYLSQTLMGAHLAV